MKLRKFLEHLTQLTNRLPADEDPDVVICIEVEHPGPNDPRNINRIQYHEPLGDIAFSDSKRTPKEVFLLNEGFD